MAQARPGGAVIETRIGDMDGRAYHLLVPAAEALSPAHPRAATRLYRLMIDSVLERAAFKAYPHAAGHLAACAELAPRLAGDQTLPSHAAYLATLRARHPRKAGFWTLVGG